MAEAASRRHFRGRPRPPRVLPVEFGPADSNGNPVELHRGETRNIGVGGAFVVPSGGPLLPVGSRVVLRIGKGLPDIAAEVRWLAQAPLEPGMGLRFLPLDPQDLLVLAAHLSPEGL